MMTQFPITSEIYAIKLVLSAAMIVRALSCKLIACIGDFESLIVLADYSFYQ